MGYRIQRDDGQNCASGICTPYMARGLAQRLLEAAEAIDHHQHPYDSTDRGTKILIAGNEMALFLDEYCVQMDAGRRMKAQELVKAWDNAKGWIVERA